MTHSNSQIKIPDPAWGSNLANVILDLEKLRSKRLSGEVPLHIFFQLKHIFHILETLGSARIEGNNTTLAEYVEKVIDSSTNKNEKEIEVNNLDEAINYIEEYVNEDTIFTRSFISDLHKIVVKDLSAPPIGEGSNSAGELRKMNVVIKKSNHEPPDFAVLTDYFESFLSFINEPLSKQYQLLMVAVAHHRFAYIHPFDNGNGRMGRLLNYALLIKLGFKVKNGRIINPSSVFYADREKYYNMLNTADSLVNDNVLAWSEYFLMGLKNELEKIDSLLSHKYVKEKILLPALGFALDRENITELESKILKYLVQKEDMTLKSEELSRFGIEKSVSKSRVIAQLRDKKIIHPLKEGGRIYTISFVNNYLLRGVIKALTNQGFVVEFLSTNEA